MWTNLMMKNSLYSTFSILNWHLHIYSYSWSPVVISDTCRSYVFCAKIDFGDCFDFWPELVKISVYAVFNLFFFCQGFALAFEIFTLSTIYLQKLVHNLRCLWHILPLRLRKHFYKSFIYTRTLILKLRIIFIIWLEKLAFFLLPVVGHCGEDFVVLFLGFGGPVGFLFFFFFGTPWCSWNTRFLWGQDDFLFEFELLGMLSSITWLVWISSLIILYSNLCILIFNLLILHHFFLLFVF